MFAQAKGFQYKFLQIIACSLLLLCTPSLVYAESDSKTSVDLQGEITLSQAFQIAEQNNPQLLAARKNIPLAVGDIQIANEIPNPQLQVMHLFGNVLILGNTHQININQTLETDGKRKKRVEAAKEQYKLSVDQYNALWWSTRAQVRQSYTDLALAKGNLELVDEQTNLAHQLLDIAAKRFNAGAAPESEVVQAKLVVTQTAGQRIQALSQFKHARGNFNVLLGKSVIDDMEKNELYSIPSQGYFRLSAQKIGLAPDIGGKLPEIDDLYKQAVASRPDLAVAIDQIKVNKAQLKLTKAQRIPDLQLSGGVQYVDLPKQYSPKPGQRLFWGPFVQVGVNLPVFHNQKAEISKAKEAIDQSSLQFEAIRNQLQQDVYNAYTTLEAARDNIKLYQTHLLTDSADALRLSKESYAYGKTNLASVIVTQQSDQQIRQGYLQAISDYQKAWTQLEAAVGKPLD